MREIATKLDPDLWQRAKREACRRAGLCLHSARKMQWASREYRLRGGRYADPAPSPRNSLRAWTAQRWRTHSGSPSDGKLRYLPDEAWKRLSPSQIRRTNRSKREGSKQGRQYVRQPADVVATIRARKKKGDAVRTSRHKTRPGYDNADGSRSHAGGRRRQQRG